MRVKFLVRVKFNFVFERRILKLFNTKKKKNQIYTSAKYCTKYHSFENTNKRIEIMMKWDFSAIDSSKKFNFLVDDYYSDV